LISTLTIGIPSFFLALEPNESKVSGRFLTNILQNALPGALTIVISLISILLLSSHYSIKYEAMSTISVLITAVICFSVLFKVCSPFNIKRRLMFVMLLIAFIIGVLFFGNVFSLVKLNTQELLLLSVILLFVFPIYTVINAILKKLNIIT